MYEAESLFDYDLIKTLKYVKNVGQYYEYGKILGQGTYGIVRKVTHKKFNMTCAMKIISKSKIYEKENRIICL